MNKWKLAAVAFDLVAAGWHRDDVIREIRQKEEAGYNLPQITQYIQALRSAAAADARAELEAASSE